MASYIANGRGCYVVNDTIVYHSNDFIAMKLYEGVQDIELLERAATIPSEDIVLFDLSDDRASTYWYIDNIFSPQGTKSNPTWYYDASNKRFKHFVEFTSTISSSSYVMTSSFQTESRAQKRVFWVWAERNNYNPIDYLNGSWSYWWRKYNSSNGSLQYIYGGLSGGTSSPFTLNPSGTTNVLSIYLNPTGTYTLSSPYSFYTEVNIYSMHIHGYFKGDTGNYNTNYYK